jgi:hypothetical protein
VKITSSFALAEVRQKATVYQQQVFHTRRCGREARIGSELYAKFWDLRGKFMKGLPETTHPQSRLTKCKHISLDGFVARPGFAVRAGVTTLVVAVRNQ